MCPDDTMLLSHNQIALFNKTQNQSQNTNLSSMFKDSYQNEDISKKMCQWDNLLFTSQCIEF